MTIRTAPIKKAHPCSNIPTVACMCPRHVASPRRDWRKNVLIHVWAVVTQEQRLWCGVYGVGY